MSTFRRGGRGSPHRGIPAGRPEPHHHHPPPDQPGFYHAAWATVLDLKNAGAALYVVVIEVPRHCED